jgi:retron-type reverse transcriptase
MKRLNKLYDKICSLENLQSADEKARKGKLRSHGVIVHDRNRENNLITLHEMLKSGTFRTSQYDIFKIYEPKERKIYRLPYFPDRIVHHAVMNILESVWVSVFTADTYSCIKERGIHATAKKVKKALKNTEETAYCLKIDIRKFYPSIDHAILKQILRRKIKDIRLLALLDEIIDSADGVPIGNYLSQYFANLYLAYFDHYIKENKRVKYYFRYADDIVILHNDKRYLHNLFAEIQTYLSDNLKLEIKSNWQIFPVATRGIDFVGYVFYHTHTLLRKTIKKRFCRRLARISRRKNLTEKEFKQMICPWWGWTKYCNSINLIKKLSKVYKNEITFKR